MGSNCYPDIASVPEKVDLAVIATPAPPYLQLLRRVEKREWRGLLSSPAVLKRWVKRAKNLKTRSRRSENDYGMRILGPNSAGIIRPGIGLNTSRFELQPEQGHIALISQSASVGSVVLDWATTAHVGFSMFVSLGSMIDIDFGDLIDFLGEDSQTRSIVIYMETVGNGRKFMSAARGFARNKPIVVMKPGQSKESARASSIPHGVHGRL